MNLLALDTSTESCSAAITINGVLYQQQQMTQRGHSTLILGMLDQLFKQADASIADIDALAFGRGPGSFTGVRIGVGVAQGIAFARELPVIPVSTLAAVAQAAFDAFGHQNIAVAMDARMDEIYAGCFQVKDGFVTLINEEKVCTAKHFFPANAEKWLGAGNGWQVYAEMLQTNFAEQLIDRQTDIYPGAATILKLAEQFYLRGEFVSADKALPVYLRNNVAKKKAQQG
ncbi:tRNA (adenosine(37)-N6)-threonylcarbamoyltransferase complex dimerization subunit type 1 TsaB [Methylophaga sp.]|uniref:tRNA (adenosine(37)-N6)-threonylcarbamoyltransferase complex dimerization subunit type 1 TsaB n=1 Tax=Methylophaga sp. TaxID=2024840 RepID=UPI003F6EA95D